MAAVGKADSDRGLDPGGAVRLAQGSRVPPREEVKSNLAEYHMWRTRRTLPQSVALGGVLPGKAFGTRVFASPPTAGSVAS